MSRRRWILFLILLGLGSFIVNRGPFSIAGVPDREVHVGSPAPPPKSTTRATPLDIETKALDGASVRDPQHATARVENLRNTRALSNENLDLADARRIRRVLVEAIERERRVRPLFVSAGIVDAVATDGRVRVIFETPSGLSEAAARSLLAGDDRRAEFESLRIYPLLGRGAAEVGPQALLHLIENPGTGQIELDAIHRASLAETIPIIRADLAHQQGLDGDGFAIAILDTGVDPTHPMYADRIIEEACFSIEKNCPNGLREMFGPGAAVPCALSGCGHGTRVAGIALGEENGSILRGVAPHAELIAIQIFSNVNGELGAYSSDILAGLQHVLGLTAYHKIAAVNLSFGGALFTSQTDCDRSAPSHRDAITLLRAAGALSVAASGNEASIDSIATPGCLSNVVAVGSTSDLDVVSSFSNSATFLGLLAPGESVVASSVGGGTSAGSGTSLATPHVVGAIATIREAVSDATANEISNALALSGVAVSDARNGVTTPRIRVLEAITLLEAAVPPPGPSASGVSPAIATPSKNGGGACGLLGLEPLLILGIVRLGRRRRSPIGTIRASPSQR